MESQSVSDLHELIDVKLFVIGQAVEPVAELHTFLSQLEIDFFQDPFASQLYVRVQIPSLCNYLRVLTLILSSLLRVSYFSTLYLSCLIFFLSSSFSSMNKNVNFIK